MCSPAPGTGPVAGLGRPASGTASGHSGIVIAYLGPPHSFTHLALAPFLAEPGHVGLACATAAEVVEKVAAGQAAYGFLAVETNLAGPVASHCSELAQAGLVVVAEVQYHAAIAIAARPDVRVDQIARVWSHEHPLLECAAWLKSNLPDVETVAVDSSSEAARRAALDMSPSAALCSSVAAEEHGLVVLHPDVTDPPGDVTRFRLFGRPGSEKKWATPTTLQPN